MKSEPPAVCILILTDCDGVLPGSVANDVERRLLVSGNEGLTVVRSAAANQSAIDDTRQVVERQSINRVLVAGCRTGTGNRLCESLASATGLPSAHIRHVGIYSHTGPTETAISADEGLVKTATRQILRGVQALRSIGDVETVEFPLSKSVVVIGDDDCAKRAVDEVTRFGLKATRLPDAKETAGFTGAFEVTVGTNGSEEIFQCGAIIDTRAPSPHSDEESVRSIDPSAFDSGRLVTLLGLRDVVEKLPRIPRERNIGIILDLNTDETKASTALACETALAVQKSGAFQVHLVFRHARVALPEISALYDQARDAGVAVLRYSGAAGISSDESAIRIDCTDTVLNAPITIECDIVAVSPRGLGDEFSSAYINNLHFSPTHSSVPGYFLAGKATGEYYAPAASADAVAAAMEVRKLLAPDSLTLELSSAIVDEEKCAICLTCIRTCPHLAMQVDSEKNIAKNIPQSCQRCGICVGVCPARAISLPEYSEEAVLALLD